MTQRLVNICFHGVGTPARPLEDGEAPYWVERDLFLRVLDDVMTWPRVDLSFDDGNASDVEIALPALVERGLTARFFVLAGRLDLPGSLGRDDVRTLQSAGMTIGTHGMHHRPWRAMNAADRADELVEARRRIQEAAGSPVDEAACPLGRYDRRLLAELRRLGYRRVHTSDRRAARAGAWVQPRFSVRSHDSVTSLREQALTPAPAITRLRLHATGLIKQLR